MRLWRPSTAKMPPLLQEELGDVLFQVLFHSQLEAEAGRFTFDDVVDGIAKKMIERHPHVFRRGSGFQYAGSPAELGRHQAADEASENGRPRSSKAYPRRCRR